MQTKCQIRGMSASSQATVCWTFCLSVPVSPAIFEIQLYQTGHSACFTSPIPQMIKENCLPCHVIVQEMEPGRTKVAAVDPLASMQAVQNSSLNEVPREVQGKMKNGMALV